MIAMICSVFALIVIGGISVALMGLYLDHERSQTRWKRRAEELWQLLDDIDTFDDACRERDDLFRNRTREVLKRRHRILEFDGYTLSAPKEV